MKYLLIFLGFFALVSLVFGMQIQGTVTNAETHSPISLVNILVEGTYIGTYTDDNGYFLLSDTPNLPFILSASHIGYQVQKVVIDPVVDKTVKLELHPIYLSGEEVVVTATRADLSTAPATFSNLTASQLREIHYSQEFPILLENLPGVYSYSDAGNPQGYSYLKIRGFDQKRISVMINGIPLNDPEDHQVYWVDMPDLAANTDDIQVQRGVGYSPYGPSAFGGSVNILTTPNPQERRLETTLGYGSYNTRKFSALFNSGVVDNTYQVYGRFSRILTDGYRDNSGFEGWSYFLSGSRYGVRHILQVNLYGGPELLHASWDGTFEGILDTNRTYNPITYRNSVDNFNQPHYELHHKLELNKRTTLNNSFFYIKGAGYWQMYKDDRDLYYYGLSAYPDSLFSDIVQQKWVLKHQTGWIPRLEYQGNDYEWSGGGNFYVFDSHHWDEIVWLQNPPAGSLPNRSSYDYHGDQWEGSLFGHLLYKYSSRLNLFGDLQFRHLDIKFRQNSAGAFSGAELNSYEVQHNFLNPKAGISYKLGKEATAYFSAGRSNREPSDQEYWDQWVGPDDFGADPLFKAADTIKSNGNPVRIEWNDPRVKPETMMDIELGLRYKREMVSANANLFWMDLHNEIIYGGGVSEGEPIMGNAEKTLHRGFEAEATIIPLKNLELYGNFSLSKNTFESDDILGLDPSYNPVPIKGNTVPLFPEVISRGRISYELKDFHGWKVKPALSLNYVGKQYLESTNMDSAVVDPYLVADFRVILEKTKTNKLPNIRIQAVLNNILNEEYETSGYYYEGNYYYPGAGRNYYLELTVGL
jgi:iron complex outermembrane receptor protein